MDFWRAPAYTAYVDYLEASGGFYYEVCPSSLSPPSGVYLARNYQRWGDAPVHSIGAALFARKNQIHFFDEIGYEHAPYQHCPREKKSWENGRCGCNPSRSFGKSSSILIRVSYKPCGSPLDYDGYSCLKKWDAFTGYQHTPW